PIFGKCVQLFIESDDGKKLTMWQDPSVAQECMEARHGICGRAVAIDARGNIARPADERFAAQCEAIVKRETTTAERNLLGSAIGLAVLGVGCIAALVFGGSTVQHHPKVWIGAIICPIGSATSFIGWLRKRQK